MKPKIKSFIQGSLVVVVSILVTSTIIKAGTITPPSETPVTAKFYTLSEIYTRLTTNATATEGGHDFTFSDSLASTHYTLTQIYDAIPTIAANTVKLGTTYLGVAGTLVPSGGDATTADVLANKTFFGDSQADWNLQTGTMANIGAQIITSSTTNLTITQGYHDGAGYCVGDTDLISTNILSGANIFGVAGDFNVVNTSSGDAANTDILSGKIAWVGGLEVTGNIANCSSEGGSTCYAAGGYWTAFDKDGDNASTAQTAAGGINYFTAPTGFYDGDDRVSATDAQVAALDADLAAGNILSSATIFGLTGSIDNCSSEGSQSCYATGTYFAGTSKTLSDSTTSQSAGYYPAFNLATVDTDLVASNIGANANIFGVSGTLLKDEYNGSAGSSVLDPTFYALNNFASLMPNNDVLGFFGGVDDYNGGQISGDLGVMPADSYVGAGWSDSCTIDDHYCGVGDTAVSADKKDNSTGLVWSNLIGVNTWFWANNCYEPSTPTYNPVKCDTAGDDGCQCVKKPSGSKVGCEALDSTGGNTLGPWRTPTQKELMQAYINGSWGNLSSAGNGYWSATTISDDTRYAWYTYLNNGYTGYNTKTTTSISVRCVR